MKEAKTQFGRKVPIAQGKTIICCAGCKSTRGQYIKTGNRFICETPGCKYQRQEIK